MPQTYDIRQSYQFNYDRGPNIDFAAPEVPLTELKEFLGLKVCSRLGIAAGLLLNSKWISAYAKLGFDILTYKTVRSSARPCYPLPNWVFVDDRGGPEGPVYLAEFDPANPEQAASAVCFGMPSMAPDIWRDDVRRSKKSLRDGQVLIVSVVASPDISMSVADLTADFCRCAQWAVEAGADVVEANFSCPNVCSPEGTIYLDAKLSGAIAAALRKSVGDAPLIIKTGEFGSPANLEQFLRAVAGAANGVVLLNCIVRPVLHANGSPVFSDQFRNVGIAGRAIHTASVAAVQSAVECVRQEKLGLEIIAVGGVSKTADVADFFGAGAAAVLMGSAPMYLPQIAAEAKQLHPEW